MTDKFKKIMLIKILYLTLCSFGIISAFMILTSLNQITRLGFIIKVFIFNALIFILLDNYFLGLTYIIVYVGAIAVLFIFVIKMVNSSNELNKKNNYNQNRLYDVLLFIFLSSLIIYLFSNFNIIN